MGLKILFHVKLGFVLLIFPPPNIILNHFVVICLLLTSLFHLQMRLIKATFVDFELVLQVFYLLHFHLQVFLM